MSGIQTFASYAPPTTTAVAYQRLDADMSQLGVLRRENDALRKQETRLRREAANQRACAEAERAESARLRAQNLTLANQLATAKALASAGRTA